VTNGKDKHSVRRSVLRVLWQRKDGKERLLFGPLPEKRVPSKTQSYQVQMGLHTALFAINTGIGGKPATTKGS
jgi:hypothetical protein